MKPRSSLGGILDKYSESQTPVDTAIQQPVNPAIPPSNDHNNPPKKKKVTLEIDEALAHWLKVECAQQGITMRDYVVHAIEYYRKGTSSQ